jgi:hypothetical protein
MIFVVECVLQALYHDHDSTFTTGKPAVLVNKRLFGDF